jgi:small subunit ribosomal protein S4
MGRYLGPTCKLSRRYREDLEHKSAVRALDSKCNMDKLPGMHGASKRRLSNYGVQLNEKQKLKCKYGVRERQFRNYFKLASKIRGATGLNLLQILETRLDNVVYRMGFASTRPEARQLVSHGAILVNGSKVNIASYKLQPGDAIVIDKRAKKQERIIRAIAIARNTTFGMHEWISVNLDEMTGSVLRFPEREEMPATVNESLVVELYSK